MIPIDIVRPSDDFVEGRLAAVRTLFDELPEHLKSSYTSGKDKKPVPVKDMLRDAVERRDFDRIGRAVSALNDAMTEDDVNAYVITGLMSRLAYDAEFAVATDVYADAEPVRTCLDMNMVLGCIEDRAYGPAARKAAKLTDRLENTDDPDVRAWMIAGIRRTADALRRLSPEDNDTTKG